MLINSINSNNSISFQAKFVSKLHKDVDYLKKIIHRFDPENASRIDSYLERIAEHNQDCKVISINNPLPARPKDIPEQKLFFLVDENYPDTVDSRKYYVPLYKKIRSNPDDKMYIKPEDLRVLSAQFPIDPKRWQSGYILEKYIQKVDERGERISKANSWRKHKRPSFPKFSTKKEKHVHPTVNHPQIRNYKNTSACVPVKPVVSPYRIPNTPLITLQHENQLPEMIIDRLADKFNRILKKLCDAHPTRLSVKKALPIIEKTLKHDKLVYLTNRNGCDEIWLASEIGKPNATPTYDGPLNNTIALNNLRENLEQLQNRTLSVIA